MTRPRTALVLFGVSVASACALDPDGLANTFDPSDGSIDASIETGGGGGAAPDAAPDVAAEAAPDVWAGCGLYAQSCCANDPPCQKGACLGGTCVELGGAFATSIAPECSNDSCASGNPHAGDLCACPPGFIAQSLPIFNDCWMPGFGMAAEVTFCGASTTYQDSDWAGAFQQVPPGTPCVTASDGCVAPNPFTAACSCPPGASPIVLPVTVPTCGSNQTEGSIVLCWNAAAPPASFGGAYLFDDVAPPCTTANPATGDCKCSAPNPEQAIRMLRSVSAALRGTMLYLCGPPE